MLGMGQLEVMCQYREALDPQVLVVLSYFVAVRVQAFWVEEFCRCMVVYPRVVDPEAT